MKEIVFAFILSVAIFCILLSFVFYTGSTFGQRCAKMYTEEKEIAVCVKRLSKGGEL